MGLPLKAPLTSNDTIYTLPMFTIKDGKGERSCTGPYAGGVRGVRANRPLSGKGPRGCMRLHGAWPPCMAVASGWDVVGYWPAYFITD